MNAAADDQEESYFQPVRNDSESTVGNLLMSAVLFFFFSLFLFGMLHTQSVSNQIVGADSPLMHRRTAEIGNFEDSAKNEANRAEASKD